MMMDRETSHHRACSSPGIHYPKHQKYPNYSSPPPRSSHIQRNLSELSSSDLLLFAKQLKHPGITTLRLYASPAEQPIVSQRFGDSDQRTADNLFAFTRALANAVEGWMQTLELGMCLGLRYINSLCPAIRYSKTLRHLSFANSGLGDVMLQALCSALQNCIPLRTLNLSGCALTDASSSVVITIVKGENLSARSLPHKFKDTSPAEHRAPKYGQQWRQNVILIGKWSPAPALGVSNSREPQPTKSSTNVAGLVALDLSCNSFTDALSHELCPVLYKRPPLRALNLRCNLMTRLGAKPVLDVMKEFNVLRLVDMRANKDECLLGVLENGEHYTTFSTFQVPFWMDPESLDPAICNSKKPRSNVPEKRSRFTALSRPKMRENQRKAAIAGQQSINIRGGGGSCNNSSSRTDMNGLSKANNSSSSRADPSPSCSGASPSRTSAEWGPNSQKRYHSSQQAGLPYVYQEIHQGMSDFDDHNVKKPRFVRPATSPASRSPSRSTWPEKTIYFDQNSYRQTPSAHMSPSRDQEYDDSRFLSPTVLEPPREHPMQGPSFWDMAPMHETDHIREMHVNPKGTTSSDGFRRTCTNEAKRSQSAVSYNTHGPRDYHNHQDISYRDSSRHQYNCRNSNISASGSSSRRWPASSTIYNGRSPGSQGRRSSEKSLIRCHHRCKLLNDVQEQQKSIQKVAKAVQVKRPQTSHFNQMLPKAPPLPEDKKELVEWNNFMNQMTQTLLNLKDGFNQLIGPTEGAIAVVAQQATTKLHQMPSSFFRLGMLRQLDRSCRVLNTHVASLTKRRKENMRHLNAENEAPVLCDEANKKEKTEHATDHHEVVGKHDSNQNTSRNVKHLGVQNNHQNVKHLGVQNNHQNVKQTEVPTPLVVKHLVMQDQLIDHPKLPPLSISKGTNIP